MRQPKVSKSVSSDSRESPNQTLSDEVGLEVHRARPCSANQLEGSEPIQDMSVTDDNSLPTPICLARNLPPMQMIMRTCF